MRACVSTQCCALGKWRGVWFSRGLSVLQASVEMVYAGLGDGYGYSSYPVM